ncbi:methionine synthase [Salsipaludibacter albus]|uniref:methionine synthase n=1 Tax=Salsipaludibacter albus TaxID=2849650 RepID=UPI001EE490E8|nr:methionine synthase [Salsipaludibacter albus]MBY5161818.1 methionine synthase [Salsipaludibacter albus]
MVDSSFSHPFLDALRDRVLVVDGAMGTSLQDADLSVEDFGSDDLEGCNEILVRTRPDVVLDVHRSFLDVGCTIIETDTFGGAPWVLDEYDLADDTEELNATAARLAREAVDERAGDGVPRFVAGSIGPGTRSPTLSLGNDPAEAKDFIDVATMEAGYARQVRGLLDGGVDLVLIETCFDLLQVKAAVAATTDVFAERGERVPIMVCFTVEKDINTMLLGSEPAAAIAALDPLPIDVLGMNCATGPDDMREHVRTLSRHSRLPIAVVPNAGIPEMVDGETCYPLAPEGLAQAQREFVAEFGVTIVGGCCGTTPEHLAQVVAAVEGLTPAEREVEFQPSLASLYGAVTIEQDTSFLMIGERANANGSAVFKRLLLDEDWEAMVELARDQARAGAHVLDVCVDYVGRDGVADMVEVIDRYATQSTLPLVIDSTEVDVVEAALTRLGGRAVINSVNLEDGRVKADRLLPLAKRYGAAVVVLAIDEEGQARTTDWKVQVCKQVADIAVGEYGMETSDLVFDCLTFPLGSGQEDLRGDGMATLDAIERVKAEIPGCYTTLGVSNVSFGLSPAARQVLNSVFLQMAIDRGLDSAIVNPAKILPLNRIDDEQEQVARDLIEDNRGTAGMGGTADANYDPLHRLMALFDGVDATTGSGGPSLADLDIEERLKQRIIDGVRDGMIADLDEAMAAGYPALHIVNEFLLDGMKVVGELFGSGQMQLPFVLQSAEAMKFAVAHLEPHMEAGDASGKGRVVLATVKGDVHDIGKNLVDIILRNNGYDTINLGIKQSIDAILSAAEERGADAVGMSGLLVKSTVVMKDNLEEMNKRSLTNLPVLLGGAALTRSYVEDDLRGLFHGDVFYCKDAFEGLSVLDRVMEARKAGVALPEELVGRREKRTPHKTPAADEPPRIDAKGRPKSAVATDVAIPEPPFWGSRVVRGVGIDDIAPMINEVALFRNQWGYSPGDRSPAEYQAFLDEHARPALRSWIEVAKRDKILTPEVVYGYWPVNGDGDELVVWDPEAPGEVEVTRIAFPRQTRGRWLAIPDFFRDVDSGEVDVLAVQCVTMGHRISKVAKDLFNADRYNRYLHAHGFGVEMAEALAELWHRRVREEWGVEGEDGPTVKDWFRQDYRGSRYSFGYAACPDLEDQHVLDGLLDFSRIGVEVTDEFMLDPEQSTSAIVVHHPEAKYFNAR